MRNVSGAGGRALARPPGPTDDGDHHASAAAGARWSFNAARPNVKRYADYGGRGITVCERWKVFADFLADMGERPIGATLDRINVNGNYEPGNCRWATRAEQDRNQRRTRHIAWRGETLCMHDLAARVGMNEKTLANRLDAGWSLERATTQPVRLRSPNKHPRAQA